MTLLKSDPSVGNSEFASATAKLPGNSPNAVMDWDSAQPYAFLPLSMVAALMEEPPTPITHLKWSKVPLYHASDYYGGYGDPRLKTAGRFMRARSDRRGEHEISSFEFELLDTDRMMKARKGGVTSRYMENRTVIARTIDDEDARAEATPRTLQIGLIREAQAVPPHKFSVRAEEYLTKYTGSDRDEGQIPKRRFSRDFIPDCPSALLGKPEVFWYGDLTSGASVDSPPKIKLQWVDGGFYNPNVEGTGLAVWHAGWGPNISSAAVPSNLAVAVAAGGNINLGDALNNKINVAVTAVDSLQRESSPIYFNWHETFYPHNGEIVANGQSLVVTWSASAGAIGYRVYFSYYGSSEAFMRVQTLATGVTVTQIPRFGDTPTEENIDPNAELIEFSESWIYAVSALRPDGETVLSAPVYGKSQGYLRPIKIDWFPNPEHLEYYVYRRSVQVKGVNGAEEDSEWDRKWTLPAGSSSFTDDLLDTNVELIEGISIINGMVPLVPCGRQTSLVDGSHWYRFLVACHAVKEIRALFVDRVIVDSAYYGKLVCVPGHAGYTNFFADTGSPQYTDLGGRRYTFVYARGETAEKVYKGEMKASANILGTESSGDGYGKLIQNLADQYEHFMLNYGIGDYQTGYYEVVSPYWPDVDPLLRVIDQDSFRRVKEITKTRMGTDFGYLGAWGCGSDGNFLLLTEVIKRLNESLGGFSYTNARSQFSIGMIDLTVTAYTDQSLYTQVIQNMKETFKPSEPVEEWANYIPYKARYNWGADKWTTEDYDSDLTSIEDYQETKKRDELELWCLQDLPTILNRISSELSITKIKPVFVEFEIGREGVNDDVAEFIGFQHSDMYGADPDAIHLMHLERWEFDGDTSKCRFTGRVRSTAHIL